MACILYIKVPGQFSSVQYPASLMICLMTYANSEVAHCCLAGGSLDNAEFAGKKVKGLCVNAQDMGMHHSPRQKGLSR